MIEKSAALSNGPLILASGFFSLRFNQRITAKQ